MVRLKSMKCNSQAVLLFRSYTKKTPRTEKHSAARISCSNKQSTGCQFLGKAGR